MNKILLTLIFGMFLISFASAEIQTLGTFKIGEEVNLIQICSNCTFNNITSVLKPNSQELIGNFPMTKLGSVYNFTLSSGNTTTIGEYIVNGIGDLDGINTIWSYTFIVTQTGFKLTNATAIIYVGLLIIMVFLFVVTIIGIPLLPSGNNKNEEGELISINNLKHLRSVLYVVGYLLLISIVFLSSNVALAYLGTTLFGKILFVIFQIMFGLAPILFTVWILFIFTRIFRDIETKKMLERGIWGNEP